MYLKVAPDGKAVGIDHIEDLVNESINNIKRDPVGKESLESGLLKLVVGDGRQGCEAEGPYDAIHVGAAAPELPTAVSQNLNLLACFI